MHEAAPLLCQRDNTPAQAARAGCLCHAATAGGASASSIAILDSSAFCILSSSHTGSRGSGEFELPRSRRRVSAISRADRRAQFDDREVVYSENGAFATTSAKLGDMYPSTYRTPKSRTMLSKVDSGFRRAMLQRHSSSPFLNRCAPCTALATVGHAAISPEESTVGRCRSTSWRTPVTVAPRRCLPFDGPHARGGPTGHVAQATSS
jgi:hypothetical protein